MYSLLASVLPLLAQTDTDTAAARQGGAFGGIFGFVIAVVMVVSLWKLFTKAGHPGWASIIPFFNFYTLIKVAGKPGWWLILMIIPFVNFVILVLVALGVAANFGRSALFGIGLAFLPFIFYPILAFGNAQYLGAGGSLMPATGRL